MQKPVISSEPHVSSISLLYHPQCKLQPETCSPLGHRMAASLIWASMLSVSHPGRTRELPLEAVLEK